MPPKKDNLRINVDVDLQNGGSITYANEVIAIIAGVAANEIDGIAGMCTSGGFGDIIGRNRNITRGVRVELGSEEASVDLYAIVEYGFPIQKVAAEVQENVRKAIESMTGLHVVRVDVHVQGVSFEKEKKEQKAGLDAAHTAALESIASVEEKPAEDVKPAQTPAEETKPAQEQTPAADQPEDELPDTSIPLDDAPAEAPVQAEEAPVETPAEAPAQAEEAPVETPEAEQPAGEAPQTDEPAPKADQTPKARKRPRGHA